MHETCDFSTINMNDNSRKTVCASAQSGQINQLQRKAIRVLNELYQHTKNLVQSDSRPDTKDWLQASEVEKALKEYYRSYKCGVQNSISV